VPLLKREPEIWPANLFGEPGGDTVDPVTVRASAALHRPPRPALVGGAARQPDRWWVAHTRSRQEKALARHLLHCEVPYYLPQREHRLRAGDRWRTSHLPLFPGYVFFHGDLQDRLFALRSNVIVKLIPAASPGELQRFAQKFGVTALIDRESRRYRDLGLGPSRLSDQHWLDKLAEEPLLLRMPLARCQGKLSIGLAEDEWKAWISSPTP